MNVGNIITKALNRSKMSVSDIATREMALEMLDEVIQQRWSQKKWLFRKATFYIQTSASIEQYGLHKLVGDILPNSMRGSDPVRMIDYKPSTEFFRRHPYTLQSGDPYEYRESDVMGVQTQPSASSQVTVRSSLANYTTGTVNVVYGSQQVIITTGAFTLDMLGRWFWVGTDQKRYRITTFLDSTHVLLSSPYEGTSNATASFAIGDVQQKVTVQGFLDDGTITEEEIQLNGTSQVTSVNTFASLNRISKSDRTYGTITATSNGGIVTNIVLDPGETEADFKTIKLYQIPTKTELITFESYARHPFLYRNSDSPLFPSQWHPLLLLDLYIKIMTEFLEKSVNPEVIERRNEILEDMTINDNDLDGFRMVQETEYSSSGFLRTNLPENYGGWVEDEF